MPAHEFVILLMAGIGDGFEEEFEAWEPADILGRRAALTIDVARIIYGERGALRSAPPPRLDNQAARKHYP